MTSRPISIDVILDETESHKVCSHDHDCNNPGDGGNERCEECANDARTESEEEGDECKSECNGVQDHDASECL